MELLFRDGVRAASRRDDGVQARAATESRRWSCAGSASVCRIAAPPTAHGAALGPLGVLKAARKSTQFQGSNLDGLVALRRWLGFETHGAPIVTSLDARTPHSSGLAPCERSRQELPPVGCLQKLPPARSRQEWRPWSCLPWACPGPARGCPRWARHQSKRAGRGRS